MNEIDRIADQLERAYHGDPWYGPSLRSVLAGIHAEDAARHVVPGAHSIWEIVLHITGWQREVARRLRDGVSREPAGGDWPAPPEASEAAWAAALQGLEEAHAEVRSALGLLESDRLEETLGEERDRPLGSGVNYYVLLHGLVQHNVAHTAQISLLSRGFR